MTFTNLQFYSQGKKMTSLLCLRSSTDDFSYYSPEQKGKPSSGNQSRLAITLPYRGLPGSSAGYPRPHQRGGSEDRWDRGVHAAPLRLQIHVLTSEQQVRRWGDKKSLGWVEHPWASGPALLTWVTFLGRIAREREGSVVTLPASKCRRVCPRSRQTCSQEHTQPEPSANTSPATAGHKSKVNSSKQIINQVGNYTEFIGATVQPSLPKLPRLKLARVCTAKQAATFWCNEKADKCSRQGFKSAISTLWVKASCSHQGPCKCWGNS